MSKSSKTLVLLLVLAAFIPAAARAQSAPSLGAAGDFAVLAGSNVFCTDSTITGDVGVDNGGVITQTNCTVNGTIHAGDVAAEQAYDDFLVAYAALASEQCDGTMLTTLAGQTLAPGVYCFPGSATETGGVLTLDGPATGIWIFKIGTSGTGALTATNFSVVMAGGGQACNVTWWVAGPATMTNSNVLGTILAGTSITLTAATLNGRALAKNAVTIPGSTVTGCAPGGSPCKVTGGGSTTSDNNFGLNAQSSAGGGANGNVNYQDKASGDHLKGANVTGVACNGNSFSIVGTGTVGGAAVSFLVRGEDNGEPGTGDKLGISWSGGDTYASPLALLLGGNTQIH